MPNNELLDTTLHVVKTNPDNWKQGEWRSEDEHRCNTTGCFAAQAAILAGGKWVIDGEKNDPGCYNASEWEEMITPAGKKLHVEEYAIDVLGLGVWQAEELFNPYNSLEDLERIIEKLKGESEKV